MNVSANFEYFGVGDVCDILFGEINELLCNILSCMKSPYICVYIDQQVFKHNN